MTEINGACACSQTGYIDNGSACVAKCGTGTTYNPTTKNCDSICDTSAGYLYITNPLTGSGFCCKIGQTACQTVCCPSGMEEIGTTGVCCNIGATYSNGVCHNPTATSKSKRRSLAGRVNLQGIEQAQAPITQLSSAVPIPTNYFGLEANRDNKLCPVGLAACPIQGRGEGEYECLDSLNDLQSCGGCASMGTGQDCTAIKGARWMGCNVGKCEVYSCRAGWKKVNGNECVQI